MTEPIYDQLTAEHARYHHNHHHPNHQEHPVSLFTTIEDEIKAAAGSVDDHVHAILAKHLTLDNIAAHVASDLGQLAGSQLFRIAAGSAGLPPAVTADIADFATKAAGWLEHEAQPAA